MLKILHTGDLHLDSPLSSLDFSAAEKARDEHRGVFERMMRYAIQNEIDMILFAGDVFDGKYVTSRTKELFISLLTEFAKPVIISPGNHDPLSAMPLYKSNLLPENVFVFSSEELQRFDFDELDVSVFGYAFETPSLDHSPLAAYNYGIMGNGIRLLCAHADLTSPISKYAPVSVADIERFGFNYAALGHVHNPPEISSDKTPINYCGFLFGRSFDELGEGGAFVVTINDGKTTTERVSFSDHSFLREELDISSISEGSEIPTAIASFIKAKGYGKNTSLRLTLTGTVPFDADVNEKALERNDFGLFEIQIRNNTYAVPDSEYLLRDPSLRGEVYRTLLPKLNSEDIPQRQRANEALRIALAAIDGANLTSMLELDDSDTSGGAL